MGRHSKQLAEALHDLNEAMARQADAQRMIATWPGDERRPLFREYWERREKRL